MADVQSHVPLSWCCRKQTSDALAELLQLAPRDPQDPQDPRDPRDPRDPQQQDTHRRLALDAIEAQLFLMARSYCPRPHADDLCAIYVDASMRLIDRCASLAERRAPLRLQDIVGLIPAAFDPVGYADADADADTDADADADADTDTARARAGGPERGPERGPGTCPESLREGVMAKVLSAPLDEGTNVPAGDRSAGFVARCRNCGATGDDIVEIDAQTRAGDEGASVLGQCKKCGHRWKL